MKHKYIFLSILLAGGLLTACSSDEPGIAQLPPGQYPLKVSAMVDSPLSRSVGKDSWNGDGTETFGVRIGSDGRVAEYVITDATGRAEAASGFSPLYWNSTDKATVSAWLPFEPQTEVDITDQSAGFAAFDYLSATAEGQSYLSPVKLNFTHKMAKVRCVLRPGKGTTEADLATAVVKIGGYRSANFNEGTLSGSGFGWITPTDDGEALLVPQNMTGKEFIAIEMGGEQYVYTPADDNAGLLKEGMVHQYTITVNSGKIEVSAVTGASWTINAVGGISVTTYYDGTETDPKPGDYYYSDGTWSDGGLRKLGADESMEWADPLPEPDASKTVIGVVFYGGHNSDDVSDYSDSGIKKEKCRGYAMALTDAGTEKYAWSTANLGRSEGTISDWSDWSGYYNKYKLLLYNDNLDTHPAFQQCDRYGQGTAFVAPASSSGWYLPSCGQLLFIAKHQSLATIILKARGEAMHNESYWTSTEFEMDFGYGDPMVGAYEINYSNATDNFNYNKHSSNRVRPVLSF